jgi:hypothetical protein
MEAVKELFNGKVGRFYRDFHIDVETNAEPYYQMCPYPMNNQHSEALKKELDQQEEMGIIIKCNEATR